MTPAPSQRMLLAFTMRMRLVNTLNAREHWSKRHKRVKAQRAAACMAFRSALGQAGMAVGMDWNGVRVVLTRVSPRPFDDHDGLQASLKGVVDGLSDAMGVDDGRSDVQWFYRQERGKPKTHQVIVQLYG